MGRVPEYIKRVISGRHPTRLPVNLSVYHSESTTDRYTMLFITLPAALLALLAGCYADCSIEDLHGSSPMRALPVSEAQRVLNGDFRGPTDSKVYLPLTLTLEWGGHRSYWRWTDSRAPARRRNAHPWAQICG